jgi:hypothetical protein
MKKVGFKKEEGEIHNKSKRKSVWIIAVDKRKTYEIYAQKIVDLTSLGVFTILNLVSLKL